MLFFAVTKEKESNKQRAGKFLVSLSLLLFPANLLLALFRSRWHCSRRLRKLGSRSAVLLKGEPRTILQPVLLFFIKAPLFSEAVPLNSAFRSTVARL